MNNMISILEISPEDGSVLRHQKYKNHFSSFEQENKFNNINSLIKENKIVIISNEENGDNIFSVLLNSQKRIGKNELNNEDKQLIKQQNEEQKSDEEIKEEVKEIENDFIKNNYLKEIKDRILNNKKVYDKKGKRIKIKYVFTNIGLLRIKKNNKTKLIELRSKKNS